MLKIIEFLTGPVGRRWPIAVLILLALTLAYAGGWIYTATQTVKAAERWTSERRAEGYTVQYDGMRATGFPFWIRLELTDLEFAAPNGAAWAWKGDNLIIAARPWQPESVSLRLSGGQMISYLTGDQRLAFSGTVAAAVADVSFFGGAPETIDLSIDGLDLASQQAGAGKIAVARGDLLWQRLNENAAAKPGATTMTLNVTSAGIVLPTSVASPLGSRIGNLQLVVRLLGQLPRGAGVPLTEALEIWRDGGGTIEVDKLVLAHGPLRLHTDGTLALDHDLQPVAAFTARIQGFFETIDAFSNLGMIGAREAVTAKLLLGVFSHRPKNGGPARLNLALTMQHRNLYAGPVKLLRLPLLRWR